MQFPAMMPKCVSMLCGRDEARVLGARTGEVFEVGGADEAAIEDVDRGVDRQHRDGDRHQVLEENGGQNQAKQLLDPHQLRHVPVQMLLLCRQVDQRLKEFTRQ